jgi:hypothetical protein
VRVLRPLALSIILLAVAGGPISSAPLGERPPAGEQLGASDAWMHLAQAIVRPAKRKKATCVSSDGKKVCDCGAQACVAYYSSCQCLKPPPPPPPDPAPGRPKLKR